MKKKVIICLALLIVIFLFVACGKQNTQLDLRPQLIQMKSICNLAVMECYYHNVAKVMEEDAETTFFFFDKDRHFWIEYGAIVKIGVDASLVQLEVNGNQVVITLPEAKLLSYSVDSSNLSKDSFIVAQDSASVKANDQTDAWKKTLQQLVDSVSNNKALLYEAQQRTKQLLEDYIENIGAAVGVEYTIGWKYVDSVGNPLDVWEATISSVN